MKKLILLLVSVLTFFSSQQILAGTFFKDTYNNIPGSGGVNTSNDIPGRQSGILAPLTYTSGGVIEVGETADYPGTLNLASPGWVYPDYDFVDSGNFVVEFDALIGLGLGGIDGLAFTIGTENHPSIPYGPGAEGSMGLRIMANGNLFIFDDGILGAGIVAPFDYTKFNHFAISVTAQDFSGEHNALVSVFVNGIPMLIHSGNIREFSGVHTNGFLANWICFNNGGAFTNTLIDNFVIRNVYYVPQIEHGWTNDADTEISSSKTYTHAIKMNSNDTFVVNGVTFTGVTNIFGDDWFFGPNNNILYQGGKSNTVEANGSSLLNTHNIIAYPKSSYLSLTNLVPGETYKLTFYSCGWGGGPYASYIAGSDGAPMVIADENRYGIANGHILSYYYIAPEYGNFSVALTPTGMIERMWYYYAFSNEKSVPLAPMNLTASQGSYSNKVTVSWDQINGGQKYQVYRNTSDDSSGATDISGELSTNYYVDTTMTINIDNYYWVKAWNSNGWSSFGASTIGFATVAEAPHMPTNVSPVEGTVITSYPVTLEGSPYFDAGGWLFTATQWQIDNNSNFSPVDWDSGEIVTNITSITVPSSPLTTQTYWRVRYKNDRNVWSEWSTPTTFNAQRDTTSPYLFLDTFNNVSGNGDVNKDYTIAGRQFGTVAPCEYHIEGTTEVGASGKLTLSGEDSSCTPGYNFRKNKEFKLEFDFEPSSSGTGASICKLNKNASPFSNGGMGFVFYGGGNGAYKVHRNTVEFTLTNNLIKSSSFHIMIAVSQTEEDGDLFSIFIDGQPLPLGRLGFVDPVTNLYDHLNYFYMFRPGEELFDDNFITLYNFGGNATIDNFKITPVSTTYSARTWETDADLWISTSNEVATFTHAVNLNWTNNPSEPVDVEGLVFECPEYIRLPENFRFDDSNPETTGTDWSVFGPDGWVSAFGTEDAGQPLAAPLPSGNAEKIARRCVYGWGSSIGIKLTSLTPNSSNIFNFYGRPFVTGSPRGGYLSGSDGGFCYVDENVVTDKCQIIEYEYIAGSDGTFTLTFTSAQGQDYMLYGFSNIETGIPEIGMVIGIFFAVSRTSKCKL